MTTEIKQKNTETEIPEGWVETTLGEVVDLIIDHRGLTPKKLGGDWSEIGYRAISAKTIKNGRLANESQMNILPEGLYKKWMKNEVEIGDIFMTSEAPLGEHLIWKTDEKLVLSQRIFGIRTNNKVLNSSYFNYFIDSPYYQHELQSRESGTTVTGIKQSELLKTKVLYPPVPEQKAIADILSSLDDKIELLREQNITLEKTAQTIFKEWFGKYQVGDDLPEGWRDGKIGDLTEIRRGGSPRPIKEFISDSGYRWLKISDATATSSPYIFNIKEHIRKEGLSKTVLKKKGDLVLSNSATPGIPKFLAVDTCVHDGWMHFYDSKASNEYLYLLFLYIRPTLVSQGSGSVFVNLKTDILRFFELVIPPETTLNNFDYLIKPIFKKIYSNTTQIQNISKTRDSLLPKLMKGDLRVDVI